MTRTYNENARQVLSKVADFFSVARGQIAGHSFFYGAGYTSSLGTVNNTTVWTGNSLYTYLAAAATLTLSSSSALDTAAGTGARTVLVRGLDGSYNQISEVMTLNGQTPVSTVNQYLRVFNIAVISAGSGGANAGVIYLGDGAVVAGVPTGKYAIANIGDNNSFAAIYTVPAGYTGYVVNAVTAIGKGKDVEHSTWIRPFGQIMRKSRNGYLFESSIVQLANFPLVVPEKTDIELRGKSSAPNTDMSINFDVIIVDNTVL